MKQYKIIICGIVQGVGFRPFIARLAKQVGVLGTVKNSSGTVIVEAQCWEENLVRFMERIKAETPPGSDIVSMEVSEPVNSKNICDYSEFTIIESEENRNDKIFIPPDLAVCDTCVEELFTKDNSRYRYPFISCVACGARYSIIKAVPYDRERTTMEAYDMCTSCETEYYGDTRRCFAQTISCHNCGPQLIYNHLNKEILYKEEALQKTISLLKEGKIVAVKSIGGYNYVCRSDSSCALKNLRKLKYRKNKPFAIMFPNINEIKKYCQVSEEEEKLLLSTERPIVLLERNEKEIDDNIVKGSRYIGGFLPYTPLHFLLIEEFPGLIITSANHSDQPIITDDSEMLQLQSKYVSGVLYNTREIVTPLDDSVTRVLDSKTQFIRRSRGYVPLPVHLNMNSEIEIAAFGGDLKAAFCLLKQDKAYMSQYFGDMKNVEISDLFMKTYVHMLKLFHIHPSVVTVDKHPGYYSRELGQKLGLKVVELQHHAAHVYSVMAEHSLSSAIGVALDGTGYGEDETIWGGEFFVVRESAYNRIGHLKPVKICGGDNAAKDAELLSYCYLSAMNWKGNGKDQRFTTIQAALSQNLNCSMSSSMGRLFDAVSAMLGVKDYNSYEGECAILLENHAYAAVKQQQEAYPLQFTIHRESGKIVIDYFGLLKDMLAAKERGVNVNLLALGFHDAVAHMIVEVSMMIREKSQLNQVALSGGVFANKILLEKTIYLLQQENFEVYLNETVPMNDGGIALGQIYYTAMYLHTI